MRHLLVAALLFQACAGTSSAADAGAAADAAQPPPVGTVETFALPPTASEGLAFGKDATGQDVLFVGGGNRIQKVLPNGTVVEHASVPGPLGMALLPDGDLVVCGKLEAGGDFPGALWRVTPAGVASVLVGGGSAQFKLTNDVAVAPNGSLLFSDSAGNKVFRVDANGTGLALVTDTIIYANGVGFSPDGTRAFVASWNGHTVYALQVDASGNYGAPQAFHTAIPTPDGLELSAQGDVIIISTGEGLVRLGTDTTSRTTLSPASEFGAAANGAFGVGAFGANWVYLTDLFRTEIVRVHVGFPGRLLPR